MIKAIIVDDEAHACNFLNNLIQQNCKDINIVGTDNSLDEAVKLIHLEHPDIVFLDVEMPTGNGLTLFDKIKTPTFDVIFTTAHAHYAMQAFRVAALDYILKPIAIELLVEAIGRHIEKKENHFLRERIDILQQNYNNLTNHSRELAIKVNDAYRMINSDTIIYVKAEGSYIEIYLINEEKPLVIIKTLNEFADMLPPEDFLRIHRSNLINIHKFISFSNGAESITMCHKAVLAISELKRQSFLERFKK